MACSAIGVSPRMYLSPSTGSGCASQRSTLSKESFSAQDFCFYRSRKGFFSELGLNSYPPKGFHLRALPTSSGCGRATYLLAYTRLGGCQRKRYYFRPDASYGDSLQSTAEPTSTFRRGGKMGVLRRGLKRTSSNHLCSASGRENHSSRKDQNSFGGRSSPKPTPFASRKKLRCWNEEGDAGEPPPSDKAALQALEQAIQFQVKEETRLFFGGPARGDLAEVEAFCRLYRHAEQLHSTVMDALRTHSTTANVDNQATLGPYVGDMLEVEEKVASGLAHLMSILHEGRGDVLGVRTTDRRNVVEEVFQDDLPPFARLRKKVRASCSVLEDALESLLPAESQQGLAARERMLKLKNACLDAGFPRPEGSPSPADIPNLAPVRLRPSKSARTLYKQENVSFWRGGHITEAGLAWLVEKGFKTIVDLREGSAQPIAQSAHPEAVASGKLRVVRMPVERGSSPSKEQVEEFARLVADPDNSPLYLHTRAGVGRASSMVSRWREVLLRKQLMQAGAVPRADIAAEEETNISGDLDLLSVDDAVRISQEDALALENEIRKRRIEYLSATPEVASSTSSDEDLAVSTDDSDSDSDSNKAFPSGNEPGTEALAPAGGVQEEEQGVKSASESVQNDISLPLFDVTKNAFEAQRPIRNVLSRQAMSKFMKRRKVPSVFFSNRLEKPVVSSSSSRSSTSAGGSQNGSIGGLANRWTPNPSLPRGIAPESTKGGVPTSGSQEKEIVKTNGNARLESGYGIGEEGVKGNEEQKSDGEKSSGSLESPPAKEENGSANRPARDKRPPEEPEDQDAVEGDMCASTTGVVRLQSRKKAEMFLVRTDGYSCTRERVKESTLAFSHPSTQQQMLMWKTPPRTVLLLKKLGKELTEETQEVASFLYHQEGMNVMVEPDVHDNLARLPGFGFIQTFFNQDLSELHERVDFVVCLGGDGVILHASNLFRTAVPPVVSFNLGSLGFLTSHLFDTHKQDLQAVIHGHNDMMTGVYITLRMRLRCELYRNGKAVPGKVFDVLNEVVVDRGSNPYLCKIECYDRNRLLTKVQADGVIIATPTGSTAYSIAAGGSMVHPNVPCMLFTPICPHSLSFRPVILPDSALLELKVPRDARSNAWVSFDGKRRQQLSKGDSVKISMSEHPLPTVNKSDQTDDWFQSLVRCLNWNERLEQRPLSS